MFCVFVGASAYDAQHARAFVAFVCVDVEASQAVKLVCAGVLLSVAKRRVA